MAIKRKEKEKKKKRIFIDPDYWEVSGAKEAFRHDRIRAHGKYYQDSVLFS